MPQGNVLDILMMMKQNGTAIDGEGFSQFDSESSWTDDFQTGKFFEIEDFDLGIDLVDGDSSSTTKPTTGTGQQQTGQQKEKTGRFSKWVQGIATVSPSGSSQMYPIEMTPFGFTKQADAASPILFKSCFKTLPFDSAVVVVRKTGGLQGKNSVGAGLPFIRIEFKDVLVISVDYDCGEVIKEKCKFVARTVQVKYRTQNADGSGGKSSYTSQLSLQKANSST
jgi:type VI protein secretion system component Hcp